jgi:hypothetical protein
VPWARHKGEGKKLSTAKTAYKIRASQDSNRLHLFFVFALYAAAAMVCLWVLRLPDALKDAVTFISTGAVVATFGSALAGLGSIWERDLLERVRLNVDILFTDLLKQKNQWRRWPFLTRAGARRMLDGSTQHWKLQNPEIPLDVGTHTVAVQIPTVLEDFFDLPLLQNFLTLKRFRVAAATAYSTRRTKEAEEQAKQKDEDESGVRNDYMLYECLHDIWSSVLVFRVARYLAHLGAALALAATVLTITHVILGVRATSAVISEKVQPSQARIPQR